jgi:thioredoxin:protein disulfide reductase
MLMNAINLSPAGAVRGPLAGLLSAVLLIALSVAAPAHAGVDLPATSNERPATGIAATLQAAQKKSAEPDFLPPDQAFRFSALPDGADSIRLIWGVTDGYYLYRARIKASSDATQAKLGDLALPPGETKMDDYFGKQEVYHHDVVGSIPVTRSSSGELTVPLKVTYQGCATAGLCYPPITKVVNVVLPSPGAGAPHAGGPTGATGSGSASGLNASNAAAASPTSGADSSGASAASSSPDASAASTAVSPSAVSSAAGAATPGAFVSEQDQLAILIRDGNLAVVLATFFGIGLLLSLTPCVLPMIPILSGIIVGQGDKVTPARGFSLAFTYAQGMALTYAAAGAIFVLVFKQAPQTFFQQPWIIMLFVTLFVALSLAMFGVYTLQMPNALQTRLTSVSNNQKSGTYVGCFVMGALSALVVTACVAPALIAALSVISQTGQVARGAAALYATGLGMGVPLLLVGASAGSLLPKVGPWMDTVKSLFGVLFIALAIYFLQPLISASVGMLLWSALAVIAGFWIFALKGRDGSPAPAALRAPGLLAIVYGIILLIGVAAGGDDPLQPLSTLRASTNAPGAPAANSQASALAFETIKSLGDLNKKVAAATAAGKPVMLDFYADWCTSCKEMERYTFSDRSVQSALSNAVLLHADVTANDPVDQELMHHFNILGPPTIAFYGPDGEERQNFRVVGYMKANDFASLVTRAIRPTLSAAIPGPK